MQVRVYHRCMSKSGSTTSLAGISEIPSACFRRNEAVEQWFPLFANREMPYGPDQITVGDLSLRIEVEEDVVQPLEAYNTLNQVGHYSLKTLTISYHISSS